MVKMWRHPAMEHILKALVVEGVSQKIKKIIGNKNITTNI